MKRNTRTEECTTLIHYQGAEPLSQQKRKNFKKILIKFTVNGHKKEHETK